MSRLSVNICGVEFKNPVIAASGTYGFGREYDDAYDIARLGGISCKGMTINKKDRNPPVRIAETPSGMLNSVGLQNPGVDYFKSIDLPWLLQKDIVTIPNIAGACEDDYCKVADALEDTPIEMIEMNISCPNVKSGGVAFGTNPKMVENIVSLVRSHTTKKLMVKLSPNVTDIGEIAVAAESAGADALSLINTITGMRIDINTRRPILHNNTGGLSGPAVFPVAVRMVNQVYNRVKIPIVGMGGISTAEDAIEIMLAGASAIQVGCAMFRDPYAPLKIIDGMEKYLIENNIENVSELTGKVELW